MPIAVITNDLQYDLVNKNQERQQAVSMFTMGFCSFLQKIRELKHYIFHLQLINLPDDPNVERYNGWLPVQKGSHGAEILREFLGDNDVIIEKNKDSGFYETNLDNELRKHQIDTVIITGMQTQICVQTTAADAFFRGYNVWVPEDGVVSANDKDKQRSLEWLDNYCATVSTTHEIIALLERDGFLSRKQVKIP